jgi:hypothetical protein
LDEWVPRQSGEARENMERYGYDEIGGLFRPHITLTCFTQRDLETDITPLPSASEFDDTASRLALFEMWENGTCTKPVATFPLGEKPKGVLRGALATTRGSLGAVREKLLPGGKPETSADFRQGAWSAPGGTGKTFDPTAKLYENLI